MALKGSQLRAGLGIPELDGYILLDESLSQFLKGQNEYGSPCGGSVSRSPEPPTVLHAPYRDSSPQVPISRIVDLKHVGEVSHAA
jgi:hypothetical protein